MRKRDWLGLCLALSMAPLLADEPTPPTQEPNGILTFYEKYPQWLDFYPVGIYGGVRAVADDFLQERQASELSADFFFANHINAFWDTNPHLSVWPSPQRRKDDDPLLRELSPYGRWLWGELAPAYEFRLLYGCAPWLGHRNLKDAGSLSALSRFYPLYSNAEMRQWREQCYPGLLPLLERMRDDYPRTLLGFITDDEPSDVAPAEGAYRFIQENLDYPPITVNPNFPNAKHLGKYLQPYAGDWYLGHYNSWNIAPQMRWMNQNFPGLVMHSMLWTCGSMLEWNEAVLPGLRDDRGWPADLRLQIWQCVALGSKGLWAFMAVHGSGMLGGGASMANGIMWPDPDHGNMGEWSRAGELLSEVGPLLLTCRAETESPVTVQTGTYERRPYFSGPAVDHGWLKDLAHDRCFLVPWNNNTERPETAELTLPPGQNVYALPEMTPVPMADGRTLKVTLEPGGGKIFLVADATEFAACRDEVLKQRSKRAALAGRKMEQTPQVMAIQRQLNEAGAALSQSEALFRPYLSLLQGPFAAGQPVRPRFSDLFKKPLVGPIARELFLLDSQYLDLRHQMLRAEADNLGRLQLMASALAQQSVANQDALRKVIDKRLAEVRRPFHLALLTEDLTEPRNSEKYTWAYQNCHVDWYAPDGKGGWGRYPDKKRLNPKDYDVLWVNQELFARAPVDPAKAKPEELLMPALLKPDFVASVRAFQQDGGGLLLSGVAGVYPLVLGQERTMPDNLQEFGHYREKTSDRKLGLAAAPGMAGHPCFNDFPPEGMDAGRLRPQRTRLFECAWQGKQPSGQVVANDIDNYGPATDYAAVVEYPAGKGKTLVMGGLGCPFSSSQGAEMLPFSGKPMGGNNFGNCERIRRFTLNSLSYLADKNARFTPDLAQMAGESAVRQLKLAAAKAKLGDELPVTGWLFATDPQNMGVKGKWSAPDFPAANWKPIEIGLSWEAQGYDHDGFAWYRRSVKLANQPGKRSVLRFGAVDEKADVYLDGKLVGSSPAGCRWDEPFELDITDRLTPQESEHLLAIRVFDQQAAGGIWRPIYVRHDQLTSMKP